MYEVKGVKRYKQEWDGERGMNEQREKKAGYNGYFIFTIMASLHAKQHIPLSSIW